jgi:hypothetical protein
LNLSEAPLQQGRRDSLGQLCATLPVLLWAIRMKSSAWK